MSPFVFFGSSYISICSLNALKKRGVSPALIVSTGFHTIVAEWAKENNIPCIAPENLKSDIPELHGYDLFLVVSYGKIIPQHILDLPKNGVLNLHPSLLPKYRGPSPIPSAILADDKHTGVTIMKMDEQMDHGPIIAAAPVDFTEWPTTYEVKEIMAEKGVELLLQNLGTTPVEQDHSNATYTKKMKKEDGLIDFADDAYLNFRKIQAYTPWPSAFYFAQGKRIKITKAHFSNGTLVLDRIIPEGKGEMDFTPHYTPSTSPHTQP